MEIIAPVISKCRSAFYCLNVTNFPLIDPIAAIRRTEKPPVAEEFVSFDL